jgi:excisionase family DNA binding protein
MPARLRSDRPEWLTLREAAETLRVSAKTITIYMKKGALQAYKVPVSNKLLFKRSEVVGLLEPVKG